jgi:hypothetical protein
MKFNIFGRKKFKCNKCGEKFKNEIELNRHEQIAHKVMLSSPWQCQYQIAVNAFQNIRWMLNL